MISGHVYKLLTLGHEYNLLNSGHVCNLLTLGHVCNLQALWVISLLTSGHVYNLTSGHACNLMPSGHVCNLLTSGHVCNLLGLRQGQVCVLGASPAPAPPWTQSMFLRGQVSRVCTTAHLPLNQRAYVRPSTCLRGEEVPVAPGGARGLQGASHTDLGDAVCARVSPRL